uniref:Uncharacterized protein n=1 Tax=Hucho hucho TaxID=62062 RepID=A0A4W5KLK5_9TELE
MKRFKDGCLSGLLFFRVEEAEAKPLFQVIQTLINRLPEGQQVMEEVDQAIAMCSEMHNIKEAIYENKKKLEAIGEDYQIQVGFRLIKTFSGHYEDFDTVM